MDAVRAFIVDFSNNPEQVARVHGHATGNCCFCTRELTDARSVAVGYGPICASHFGLEWGERRAEQYVDVGNTRHTLDGVRDTEQV
jgi:hypothetical protein